MGGYGGWNPYPFEYGGGTSDVEAMWRALRRAVGGDEGLAGPEMGLEDSWRFAKAEAIAAACVSVEHAAFQALPNKATSAIEVYEDLLLVAIAGTDEQRRQVITKAFTLQLAADVPSLRAELQRVDPAADVETQDYTRTVHVQFGKTMGPRSGTPFYGLGGASDWPNYSSDFVLNVRYTLTVGVAVADPDAVAAIERYLREVLPAWVDFSIHVGAAGFYLDGGADGTSLLDQTAFD